METYTHAYIYLIREREFLLRDEPVFKIGRGAQNADRVVKRVATGYKKGSEIWLTIRCPMTTYKDVETYLKSIFCERFKKHGDGSEYFEGDPTEMAKLITGVVHNSWWSMQVNYAVPKEEHMSEEQKTIDAQLKVLQAAFEQDQLQHREQEARNMAILLDLRRTLINTPTKTFSNDMK